MQKLKHYFGIMLDLFMSVFQKITKNNYNSYKVRLIEIIEEINYLFKITDTKINKKIFDINNHKLFDNKKLVSNIKEINQILIDNLVSSLESKTD